MKISSRALAVGAALVVVAAGTFGAFRFASAQDATPSAGTPSASATPGPRRQVVQDFLGNLASTLNVSADTLKSDLKTAALNTVDQEVQAGKLTDAQATKIKDAINSGKLPVLRGILSRARARAGILARAQIGQSAATAIGIQPSELRSELQSGKSIADVAQAHNVSLDSVKTQITTDMKSKLDQAVSNGKLTQQREDQAMTRLQDNLDKILSHAGGKKVAPVASSTPGA